MIYSFLSDQCPLQLRLRVHCRRRLQLGSWPRIQVLCSVVSRKQLLCTVRREPCTLPLLCSWRRHSAWMLATTLARLLRSEHSQCSRTSRFACMFREKHLRTRRNPHFDREQWHDRYRVDQELQNSQNLFIIAWCKCNVSHVATAT